MSRKRKFGTYTSRLDAKKAIKRERILHKGHKWAIIKKHIGRSIENQYSDYEGNEYQVWVEFGQLPK